jgi:hypothetical protein
MDHKKIYNKIIERAKKEKRIKFKKADKNYIYYERHHIIPRCLGGNDANNNLVLLTAREHFICHKLLTYIYPNDRNIALAFHQMTFGVHKKSYNVSSRDFSYARERISLIGLSQETKRKISEKHKNKVISLETRKKMSEKLKGLKRSEETKKRISDSKKIKNNDFFTGSIKEALIKKYGKELGQIKIDTYIEKIRIAHIGRKATEETKRKLSISSHKRKYVKCQFCNKEFDPANFKRWHGNNCKNKI